MHRRWPVRLLTPSLLSLATLVSLVGCRGSRTKPMTHAEPEDTEPLASATPLPAASARRPPRCRVDGPMLAVSGDDPLIGEGVATRDGLVVGLVRRIEGRRVASVLRAPLTLSAPSFIDLGPAFESDRAPVPYAVAEHVFVAFFVRGARGRASESLAQGASSSALAYAAGASRELRVVRLDGSATPHVEGAVQQAVDESEAFDIAWPEPPDPKRAPLVAWDEDAPRAPGRMLADRGLVKVQLLAPASKPRVVSPDGSDVESPRLFARPDGGYWLAWLAKRPDLDDAGSVAASASKTSEISGESRVFRWIELVGLDGSGTPTSGVVGVTGRTGHVAAFELVPSGEPGAVTVLAEDEAEDEGKAGAHVVRYDVSAAGVVGPVRLADGVAAGFVALARRGSAGEGSWMAWADADEQTHLAPLPRAHEAELVEIVEPALAGARPLAASGESTLFAVTSAATITDGNTQARGPSRPGLVRLACP